MLSTLSVTTLLIPNIWFTDSKKFVRNSKEKRRLEKNYCWQNWRRTSDELYTLLDQKNKQRDLLGAFYTARSDPDDCHQSFARSKLGKGNKVDSWKETVWQYIVYCLRNRRNIHFYARLSPGAKDWSFMRTLHANQNDETFPPRRHKEIFMIKSYTYVYSGMSVTLCSI